MHCKDSVAKYIQNDAVELAVIFHTFSIHNTILIRSLILILSIKLKLR